MMRASPRWFVMMPSYSTNIRNCFMSYSVFKQGDWAQICLCRSLWTSMSGLKAVEPGRRATLGCVRGLQRRKRSGILINNMRNCPKSKIVSTSPRNMAVYIALNRSVTHGTTFFQAHPAKLPHDQPRFTPMGVARRILMEHCLRPFYGNRCSRCISVRCPGGHISPSGLE